MSEEMLATRWYTECAKSFLHRTLLVKVLTARHHRTHVYGKDEQEIDDEPRLDVLLPGLRRRLEPVPPDTW